MPTETASAPKISTEVFQQQLLAELATLLRTRTQATKETDDLFARLRQEAKDRRQERLDEARSETNSRIEDAQRRYQDQKTLIDATFAEQTAAANAAAAAAKEATETEYKTKRDEAIASHKEAAWVATTVYEDCCKAIKIECKNLAELVESKRSQIETLGQDCNALLTKWKLALPTAEPAEKVIPSATEPLESLKNRFDELYQQSKSTLAQLQSHWTQSWLHPGKLFGLAAVGGLVVYLIAWLVSGNHLIGGGVGGVLAAVGGAVASKVLTTIRNQNAIAQIAPIENAVHTAAGYKSRLVELAKKDREVKLQEQKDKLNAEHKSVAHSFETVKQELIQKRASELTRFDAEIKQQLAELTARHAADQQATDEQLRPAIERLREDQQRQLQRIVAEHETALTDLDRQYHEKWDGIKLDWRQRLDAAYRRAQQWSEQVETRHPDWPKLLDLTQPALPAPMVRMGAYHITTAPDDGQASAWPTKVPTSFSLPFCLPFPERGSLIVRIPSPEKKADAVRIMQTAMLRFLTGFPPGKVRFIIVDPVGLGQDFSAFMHLADFDEALVAHRIWTAGAQVEKRLSDLTAHMEDIIQKYLRNQYQSIDEYNLEAGEVAEPYRVLVIHCFPTEFHEQMGRRLASICATGAKCGVFVILSIDERLPKMPGIEVKDLEPRAVTLGWDKDKLAWLNGNVPGFPLTIEAPPADDLFTKLVQNVGEQARHASRVEVSFDFVAPSADKWWSQDSRSGLSIPIGRAGATARQRLELGKGTAQHALIAGKTGSGKSTLLHVLITNAALCYNPDEVELYLVDFKKGVEFKTYARHQLPHAKVIAIESDREFGLSVLSRLDEELRTRGELFRSTGVNDLKSYRDLNPTAVMPRILLIVDEFQEFFIEDDKLSVESNLLLDRLVRQGRAFGIHVLLGSQTLGGAFSLARTTIDQMAVRIALQCSEADAQLILSDDNTAARLLTRPGQAIYNDANGLVEGNHRFQTVWLSELDREAKLAALDQQWRDRTGRVSRPLVFEGNADSRIEDNPLIEQWLKQPSVDDREPVTLPWGEPIAIGDPLSCSFARQVGHHLLMLGQQPTSARSQFAAGLLSLACQLRPRPTAEGGLPAVVLFDAKTGVDGDIDPLSYLARRLPIGVETYAPGQTGPILTRLSDEVTRRSENFTAANPPIFLFLHDLQRFRELAKTEDEYGFSKSDEGDLPTLLGRLIKEGPAVGIHLMVWCDSLTILQRMLDRNSIKQFERLILFQMSPNDSTHLTDSPIAGTIGPRRAVFFESSLGRLIKYRPYGPPTVEFMQKTCDQLRQRTEAAPN